MRRAVDHWKARNLDFSRILYKPTVPRSFGRTCSIPQDHGVERSLDATTLLPLARPAIEGGEKVEASLPIRNTNRVVGTMTGSEVTRRHGAAGLPPGTITFRFTGSAGQSFGAFIPRGMTLLLEGDANDYLGKGLSGGSLAVFPPRDAAFVPEENVVIGNVALYGATGGEAFIRGVAGERFAVRNSGASAVVEGVGDHGCEYMTGGTVAVLGRTGRNFAAGMSGGVAYVYDPDRTFAVSCNKEMVGLTAVDEPEEVGALKALIERHVAVTGSELGRRLLGDWKATLPRFVKVLPHDYRRMVESQRQLRAKGMSPAEAELAAFELNAHDQARVGGN